MSSVWERFSLKLFLNLYNALVIIKKCLAFVIIKKCLALNLKTQAVYDIIKVYMQLSRVKIEKRRITIHTTGLFSGIKLNAEFFRIKHDKEYVSQLDIEMEKYLKGDIYKALRECFYGFKICLVKGGFFDGSF